MKKISVLLFSLILSVPVFAQAGKLDKSAVRLKFAGVGGFYVSDWEKRNQNFNLVYNRVIESNWQDQNKGTGVRFGVDYYASLKNPLFTHLLFGANFSDLKGSFPTNRFNANRIETLNYKAIQQQIEFTFGTVISVFDNFRVIPKFVHRTVNQDINSNTTMIIYDSVDAGFIRGREKIRSRDTSGFVGFGMEYDLTPNLSLYFDSLLLSNVLFISSGKYTYSKTAEGYLTSNGSIGISNRFDDSTGTFKISGNRFLLGVSLKASDSIRVFLSAERDTIYTNISAPFGTNLLLVALLSSSGSSLTSDTINKTIIENIMYTQRQKYEATTLILGVSKDLDI